jgi:hypothetical protein
LILAISSGVNGALGIVIFGALFFATLGAAAAFVLGCLVGLLFVAIDIALVTATHAILDDSGKRLS